MTTKDEDLEGAIDALRDPKSGKLERPIGAHPLLVPREVWIEGDRLCWRTRAPGLTPDVDPKSLGQEELDRLHGKPLQAVPGRNMLERFIRLHRETDEAIRAFGAKWGPLGICEHGRPHTHWPLSPWDVRVRRVRRVSAPGDTGSAPAPEGVLPCYRLVQLAEHSGTNTAADSTEITEEPVQYELETERNFCQPLGMLAENGTGGWEPLERWRYYSREAAALVRTACALHELAEGEALFAEVPSADAYQLLYGRPMKKPVETTEWVDWRWVRTAVERWLSYGNVRPYLHGFLGGGVSVGYGTADCPVEDDFYFGARGFFVEWTCGLFGALATQLLLVVTNQGGLANCTSCGLPYFPSRRPAKDERAFCWDPECRKAKNRLSQQDRRARARGELESRKGEGRPTRRSPGQAPTKTV